jgi:transcription elongation factor Elf1
MRKLDGDLIVEVQDYLPEKFECIACQLKIAGLSQLTACGLNTTYKVTSTYEAADYYAPEDDPHSRFDDDNNEY